MIRAIKNLYFKIANRKYKNLSECLRQRLDKWETETKEYYKYKCMFTGSTTIDTHHLYSFNLIVKETIESSGLSLKPITEYTEDELNRLIKICQLLHKKHGIGVCLHPAIHKLFHKLYGYGNNNSDQFEDFKCRYYNDEFKNKIKL